MTEFNELIKTVAKLRDKDGCPWDKAQTLYSMKKDMIEEAFELLDALDNKDIDNIKEELGDLLLHVVMHSQIAGEEKLFNISDVIKEQNEKLIRRHPHVFSKETLKTKEEVLKKWEEIKKQEKSEKKQPNSILDNVPSSLPSLYKAQKLQKIAAKTGFDWKNINDIFLKLDEEVSELKNAINNNDIENISEELGDVLFVLSNIANHLKIDADESLRKSNQKFKRRFLFIENSLKDEGKNIENSSLEEMENLWQKAKESNL